MARLEIVYFDRFLRFFAELGKSTGCHAVKLMPDLSRFSFDTAPNRSSPESAGMPQIYAFLKTEIVRERRYSLPNLCFSPLENRSEQRRKDVILDHQTGASLRLHGVGEHPLFSIAAVP
jgi:hypothetical protein